MNKDTVLEKEENQMAEANEKHTNEVKVCPFTKEACSEGKCSLWTQVIDQGGKKRGVCVFQALLLITATRQQPVMMQRPGNMPPGLGEYGIFKS